MPYIGNSHIAGDHTNNFKVLDDISSFTATFDGSASSVIDTTNNTIRVVEHRFIQGQRVTYTNGGGGNIGGLTTGTAYFVIFDTANTVKLATNASNAASSTAINLSAVGSGSSHTLNVAFDGVNTKFKLTHGSGTGARLNNATQINVAINNVVQRPNLDPNNFTDGFALEDNHKIVFKIAPTNQDIFWGSIIANTLTTFDISDHKIDTFTGDGSTTEFTLSHTPANNESLMVTINGVLQHPSNASTARAYTLIASIIQFTAAPANGDEIQVRHLGFAGATTADVSGFYGRTGNVVLGSTDHITTGDITSRNINASGIITASQFVGSFSPNVGGSNANFTGIVTAGTFKGGNIDAVDGAFSGNVTIGGTLTYEDVTNIDSVGLVTARDGIFIPDNKKLEIGNASGSSDLRLYHDGSDSYIQDAGTGDLIIKGSNNLDIKSAGDELKARFITNGAVELYHNDEAKILTKTNGATVQDLTATGAYLDITSSSGNNGKVYGVSGTTIGFLDSQNHWLIKGIKDGAVELNHDNLKRFETTTTGARIYDDSATGSGTPDILTLFRVANNNGDGSAISFVRSPGTVRAQIIAVKNETANNETDIVFKTTKLGTLEECLRIKGSNKNVGIGTDNPTQILHILDDSPIIQFTDTNGLGSRINADSGNLYLDTHNLNRDVIFRGGNSSTDEVARITGDGKVGIGTDLTTTPSSTLTVSPHNSTSGRNISIYTSGAVGDKAGLFFNQSPGTGNLAEIQAEYKGTNEGELVFSTSMSKRITIQKGGNVGVGTDNPSHEFHVYDKDSLLVTLFESVTHDSRLRIKAPSTHYSQLEFADGDADTGEIRYDHTDDSMQFFVNNNVERVRITPSGQFLVGATSADVDNKMLIQDSGTTILKINNTDDGTAQITLANTGSSNGQIKQISGDMTFSIAGNEKARITSNGKIGINSTAPLSGFDVRHDDGMFIKTSTNAAGAKLRFSDNGGFSQIGTIEYKHSDNSIVNGANDAFVIQGSESRTAVQIEGQLTVTQQPCAVVYQCTGPSGSASVTSADNDDPLHFDHVHINQGNMSISNGNARITVPTTGIYFVSYMVSGTVSSADEDDGIELLLLRNGNEYPSTNSGAEPVFNFGRVSGDSEFFCNNTMLVSLDRDDYVEVALDNIGSSGATANVNRGNFCVMLMG